MPAKTSAPLIGIIMGSRSDWPTLKHAADVLDALGVRYEARVVSAHRTPERLYEYAKTAKSRGLKAIIAGAGGAAHLPGMTASMTALPVLGVPVESRALKGLDSLLSIAQMPGGVPVGISTDGQEGPGAYGLNRKVQMTILVGKDDKVTANFALVQPSAAADGPRIAQAIVDALGGGKGPTAEELQQLSDPMRRSRTKP